MQAKNSVIDPVHRSEYDGPALDPEIVTGL